MCIMRQRNEHKSKDTVENLQACCVACNALKGAALPEDFANRVNAIFLYQMERKYAHKITWKLASWMIGRLDKNL